LIFDVILSLKNVPDAHPAAQPTASEHRRYVRSIAAAVELSDQRRRRDNWPTRADVSWIALSVGC